MSDANINSDAKWQTYGNNYFVLSTNVNGTVMYFDGVLSELPPVGMSTDWQNSPAAEIGEKLEDLLNNDILQFIAANQPDGPGGKMQAMDAMTARIYKGYAPPKFDLKFRCYPGQKIGPHSLRNAGEWKLFLALTTPPNSNCGFSVGKFLDQIADAMASAEAFFSALGKEKDDKKQGEESEPAAISSGDLRSRAASSQIGINSGSTGAPATFTNDAEANDGMKEIEQAIRKYNTSGPGNDRAHAANQYKIFGANLFQLKIYPFIYNSPLTVYIDSWSVTPSREWNTDMNDHYYYDFTISCTMDQVLSAKSWLKIIS